MESIVPCVEYVESHLARASSNSLSDEEMLHLFGGGGGFQVDAVLYMIDDRMQLLLSPIHKDRADIVVVRSQAG